MIPLKLTIQGLYSYQERQTIDFQKLTSDYLFGIFGNVGSGKSSILEAMMFAIYGDSERLSSRGDNRNYNILNLQSNHLFLELDCMVGDSPNSKYRFQLEIKRRSKKFEETATPKKTVYRWEGNRWGSPLENPDPEKIIGLSYKNFKQTVIIPQGKFKEFIDLGPTGRTEMLQKVFKLDNFDLFHKAKALLNEEKSTRDKLLGELRVYEKVDHLGLERLNHEATLNAQNESLSKARFEKLAEEFKVLEQQKKVWQELASAKNEQRKLLAQKPNIETLKIDLNAYQHANLHFRQAFERGAELKKEWKEAKESLDLLLSKQKATQEKKIQAEKLFQQAQDEFQKKDILERQLLDYQRCIEAKEINIKIDDLHKHLALVEKELSGLEQQETKEKKNLSSLKETYQKTLAKKKDTLHLQKVINALQQIEILQKDKKHTSSSLRQIVEKIDSLKNETIEINTQFNWASDSDWSKAQERIETASQASYEKLEALKAETYRLKNLQREFEAIAHLEDGQPCPTCGSTHHPNKTNRINQQQALDANVEEINTENAFAKKLEQAKKGLTKIIISGTQLHTNQEQLSLTLQEADKKIKELNNDELILDNHLSLEEAQSALGQALEIEKSISSLANRVEHSQAQLQKITDTLRVKSPDKTATSTKIDSLGELLLKTNAKVSSEEIIHRLSKQNLEALQLEEKKLSVKVKNIDENYEKANSHYNQIRETLAAAEASSSMAKEGLDKKESEAKKHHERVKKAIETDSIFHDALEVKEVLSKKIDTKEIQLRIDTFSKALAEVEGVIKTLEKQTSGQTFNEESYETLTNALTKEKANFEKLQKQTLYIKQEIKDLEERLDKKKQLEIRIEAQENKLERVSKLTKLFESKGFVKYIATVYLKNLVAQANKRFFKLTNNTLSLELNEQDDFIVRDYLNEGKIRLLKTLSGGQTFQAALCLALALAENVKSLNKAEKSFFFLDEGFGTLDRNALQTVFETLQSLKKENRIVGVISHVEELKQELSVFLQIKNNPERGSQIAASWENIN